MLVYANHMTVKGPAAPESIFRSVGAWLKEQLSFGLHPDQLKRDGDYEGTRGAARSWLRISTATEGEPELYSWALTVLDSNVHGRKWITELGMKQAGGLVELSCVVRTDEQSTLVADPVAASQPRVIRYVVSNTKNAANADFATSVPGLLLKTVGEDKDSYRALLADIERSSRDYPIVLVSPDSDGQYLINAEHLQTTLFGLAQVVRVFPEFNSYDMEEVLGRSWSAWDGAVNVLHTPARTGFVRGRFFVSDAIEDWGDTQHDRISQILAWVTNNTNIARLRNRIRPEGVVQLAMRRRLQAIRAKGAEMDAEQLRQELESAGRLEQEQAEWIDELERDNERMESDVTEAKAVIDDVSANLQKKEYELQALKDQLAKAGAGRSSAVDVENLLALASRGDQPAPSECLEVLQSVHGDKCLVLDTAWKSAADVSRFSYGRQLLSMLLKLVTSYRNALMSGGDSQAKKIFGKNEYAAKESETVIGNKSMLRARTFEYNGKPVQMLRHLKIGADDDKTKTIRVHFHWDPEEQRIVIGHCGAHLPIASH